MAKKRKKDTRYRVDIDACNRKPLQALADAHNRGNVTGYINMLINLEYAKLMKP